MQAQYELRPLENKIEQSITCAATLIIVIFLAETAAHNLMAELSDKETARKKPGT